MTEEVILDAITIAPDIAYDNISLALRKGKMAGSAL